MASCVSFLGGELAGRRWVNPVSLLQQRSNTAMKFIRADAWARWLIFSLLFFFLKSQDVATSHFHNSVPTLEFANAAPRNVRVVSTALLHLVIFDPLPVFGGVP